MPSYQPNSISDLVVELSTALKAITEMRKDLASRADDAGEIIAIAYDIAATGDSAGDPSARGNEMQRLLLELGPDLESMAALLKAALQLTRRAVTAMDASFAQRRTARAKLGN